MLNKGAYAGMDVSISFRFSVRRIAFDVSISFCMMCHPTPVTAFSPFLG